MDMEGGTIYKRLFRNGGEIMITEFVTVELKNNPAATASLVDYQDIIRKYADEGYSYQGFIPVKLGPSGKILSIDIVFQK